MNKVYKEKNIKKQIVALTLFFCAICAPKVFATEVSSNSDCNVHVGTNTSSDLIEFLRENHYVPVYGSAAKQLKITGYQGTEFHDGLIHTFSPWSSYEIKIYIPQSGEPDQVIAQGYHKSIRFPGFINPSDGGRPSFESRVRNAVDRIDNNAWERTMEDFADDLQKHPCT